MGIKAIVFDLDGVVVDSEPIHYKTVDIVLQRKGIVIKDEDEEIRRYARGRRVSETWAYLKERFQLPDGVNDLRKEARETLWQLDDQIRLMHGFEYFVKKIRPSYKTALVTSGRRPYIERLESRLSILHYFDCVVTGDDTEEGKPSPDPYLLACKKLQIEPKEAVAIEDAPNGIESAKKAGCTCIAVTFTFPQEELKSADYIARDFAEVEKIIEGLQ